MVARVPQSRCLLEPRGSLHERLLAGRHRADRTLRGLGVQRRPLFHAGGGMDREVAA
jgi:hypothetical protein